MPHSPGIGAIFGIVSENGVAKSGGRVGLYDRTTMLLVNKTVADALGGYKFTGLNQLTSDYLVLALDDDGSPAKNALVQDYIQPIPGHMGSVAYSNWQQRARRKDPFCLFLPRFQGQGTVYYETMGATGYPLTRGTLNGGYVLNGPTITPGAPQFPTIKLTSGSFGAPLLVRGSIWPAAGPEGASLEFVIDTSFDTQITVLGSGYISTTLYYVPMLGMSFTAATKLIRVGSGKAAGSASSPLLDLSSTTPYNTGTIQPSSLPPGLHHFLITVALSSVITIYIDGASAGTISITGSNGQYDQASLNYCADGYVFAGAIGGSSSPALGSGVIGPIAAYHSQLTAADALALYNDLMVGTTPASTGYTREVFVDDPAVMYRLDEAALGSATEFLTGLPSGTHYGAFTFIQPSPVVGGSMTYFNGGAIRALRGSGPGSPMQRSWECWVAPAVSPPPATRTLFAGHQFANGGSFFWKVQQLVTTGALQLQVLVGTTTTESIAFTYAPPANVTTHIVIVLDKVALLCRLYVNGVLQESVVTTGTFMSEGNLVSSSSTTWFDTVLTIGGWVTDTIVISEAFIGSLSEVTVYYKALPADRIKAHYDARLLI